MYEAIKNFNSQFGFNPVVENGAVLKKYEKYIIVGMGGSHLAGDLLKIWSPSLDLIIHKSYGLPPLPHEELGSRLVILSSYSGNTEEVLDAYEETGRKKLSRVAISIGGELLARAQKDSVPFIKIPDTGIQPRSALGFNLRALLKILGTDETLKETAGLERDLKPEKFEAEGKDLAEHLSGRIPVVYTSAHNEPIAYNWKIKFNETGKIPAFYNVFPELNHNEMTGFDVKTSTKKLSEIFSFIFLADPSDHPKIKKRMAVMETLFSDRGLPVKKIELGGKTVFHRIFSSLVLADWAAYHTAVTYGLDPEQVPIIEEFKKLITK